MGVPIIYYKLARINVDFISTYCILVFMNIALCGYPDPFTIVRVINGLRPLFPFLLGNFAYIPNRFALREYFAYRFYQSLVKRFV